MSLTISNIVPEPQGATETVHCAACCHPFVPNNRGSFFCGPSDVWWVCDDCGATQRPDLVPLLDQLRRGTSLTVTVGGVGIDLDDLAWTCPLCNREPDEEPDRTWHVVDRAHGRPVCSDCLQDVEPALLQLRDALLAAEENDMPEHAGAR